MPERFRVTPANSSGYNKQQLENSPDHDDGEYALCENKKQ